MTVWVMAVLAAEGLTLLALTGWAIHFARTDRGHLESFTPKCSNCDESVHARWDREPAPRARIRDHMKLCLA